MSDGDPRVTVVMITHDRRDEALRTLDRLTRLPERPPIIVIDNGSADGTAAAVAGRFPGLAVLDAGGNAGAAGRNLGLRRAATPYVALCDDDVWWAPGALRRAADLLDAHPRVAVLVGRVLVGPEEEEDPICRELERSPVPAGPGLPGPALLGFLAGASVVRRDALLAAGGFEPRFFIGGEEELLAVDLAAAGWRLCYVPELVVHHHPSERRDAPRRRQHVLRNALWCTWLRRPLGVAVARTLRAIVRGPWDGVTLRGLTSAAAGLPWVLRRRRVLPRDVERGLRRIEAAAKAHEPAARARA
jgi:GT2 family glycosyltransferase